MIACGKSTASTKPFEPSFDSSKKRINCCKDNISAAGTPATTEEEANTRFGIVKAQFDSIMAALGGPTSDWEFVNIDFNDFINNAFTLTYKHSTESSSRKTDISYEQ